MNAEVRETRQTERGVASVIEAYRRLARGSERGAIEEHDHVISIVTGMPVAAFNPTFIVQRPRDIAGAFGRVHDFYARRGHQGVVHASGDTARSIAEPARAAGLVAGHGIPCHVLPLLDITPPPRVALEVQRVGDAAALAQYNDLLAEVFELDAQALAAIFEPWLLELPGIACHLGHVDGLPVATAMSCCIDDVAVVFNIATLPSHRRRGIGEAMTWRAVEDGLEQGCDVAFLQASTAGRPLYERMGFRHVTDVQTWSLP
jgi:ribosomal protein S18 acetylase RimI-like enzyme